MNAKKKSFRGWLLIIPAASIVVALVVLTIVRMEGKPPELTLEMTSPALGRHPTLAIRVADAQSGLRKVWVGLVKDGQETVLLEKIFPAAGLLSGGRVREENITVDFEPEAEGIKDGKAMLRLVVRDYSWRQWGKGNVNYQEQEVIIDTRPPAIDVLSRNHYFSQGGAGLVIYKLSEACATSGVMVGEHLYPGTGGFFKDQAIHMALAAVDHRQGPGTDIHVIAVDFAGNQGRSGLPHLINARRFKQDKINISDSFLDWKMPEFVHQVGVAAGSSHLEIFLEVNGALRRENYETLTHVTARSDPKMYWEGAFLRLAGAANRAGFADARDYLYDGKVIDHQTHLGVDLASVAQSPVPAANHGKVVMADALGIYGRTVVIDHGMGLFSMYAHLSHIGVRVGQMVKMGDTVGKTGRTGLAGGDHLHFSILVHDSFVNPVEWWDEQWVRNNITSKIKALGQP
ncbi:MAG: M23 family metallopeptidase [Desulfatitalea sp.]|nr:M23 family metallopeptidase [Desulfatitalea sp.]NNJ99419.1 M23 family metallopeptidase [Desulfatitalea sp.]